jgi:hypothetical protein
MEEKKVSTQAPGNLKLRQSLQIPGALGCHHQGPLFTGKNALQQFIFLVLPENRFFLRARQGHAVLFFSGHPPLHYYLTFA